MNFTVDLENNGLVNMATYGDGIMCDMRYATTDNLMHESLYATPSCYLRQPVADALNQVQASLREHGLSLKIWDAYRPVTVQNKLVAFVNNTDYTPSVSNHSRGVALDVTLVDSETGVELDMPTKHDDLSDAAHQDAPVKSAVALRNRELLKSVMQQHGFTVYPYEWWHFDYLALADAEPLDVLI